MPSQSLLEMFDGVFVTMVLNPIYGHAHVVNSPSTPLQPMCTFDNKILYLFEEGDEYGIPNLYNRKNFSYFHCEFVACQLYLCDGFETITV